MAKKLKLPKLKLPKIKLKLPGKKFWLGKKFLISASLAVVVIFGGIFIGNSMKRDSIYKQAMRSVAEARFFMKSGTVQNVTVQFIIGKREEPYKQDGIAGTPTAFGLVNVNGDETVKGFDAIEGTIKISGEQFPISLVQNPYNPLNFSDDIIKSLPREVKPDDEVEVTLHITNNNPPLFQLSNTMTADAISWDRALRIATSKMSDRLKGQSFESYVTIIYNMADDAGAFWYVQFITTEGRTHFAVVAPDGSVIS